MITEASIQRTLYHPEQLPDANVIATLAAASEAAPPVLDLRRFSPLILRLTEVLPDQNDNVDMRFKVDNTTLHA